MFNLSVIIVDEQQLHREALRIALAHQHGIDVLGETSEPAQAAALADTHKPSVAVVISRDGRCLDAARALRQRSRKQPILVVSNRAAARDAALAFSDGVNGYALISLSLAEVVEALRVVASGARFVAPGISLAEIEAFLSLTARRSDTDPIDNLSLREREVFDWLVHGLSNDAVARRLFISPKTVETHRCNVFRKVGVHSLAELVRFAAARGLLRPAA